MWSTFDRTRRRLVGVVLRPALVFSDPPPAPDAAAMEADTPDRLEAALAEAIVGLGATGCTRVARRPAGLYTPEAWQVRLTDAEPAIEIAIRRAIRGGVFAA